MIFRHNYLSQQYIKDKQTHIINKQNPLLLLISDKFTFMNQFLINNLKLQNIAYEIKITAQQQLMSYSLPAIVYKNNFLTQQNLIQFICDLSLQNQSYENFNQRKQLIKDQYKKWFILLKQQHQSLVSYTKLANIGIHTQQDYYNHIYSQYFSIASWVKGDILQKKYTNYKKDHLNIQTLFVYDVIDSILKLCEKTQLQYVLRSSFQNLMEWRDQYENKIKNYNQQQERIKQITIVTQIMQIQNNIHPKIQINHRKFAIILTVLTGLYIKFVS